MRNNRTSEQITRDYMDSLLLEMRCLDAVIPDTHLELFGHVFDTPVMTAALSHLPDMKGWAQAGKEANAAVFTGMGSKEELEGMIATGAQIIKIIKPYRDNTEVFARMEHAAKAGALALGMDIDHGFTRSGGYDSHDGLLFGPKTTDDLRSFVDYARKLDKPFVVKGVLSVVDAMKCKEAGVSGIILSHHNGRQDYAVPPAMLLPEVRKAVGPDMKIFVDCALLTGTDAFKVLALGADACCYGRSLSRKLQEGGVRAMTEEIQEITRELAYNMAMTATKDLRSVDASVIR